MKISCFEHSVRGDEQSVALPNIALNVFSPEQIRYMQYTSESVAGETPTPVQLPKARDYDMWCKACIFYYCLYGCMPVNDFAKISKMGVDRDEVKRKLSADTVNLFNAMFEVDPANRTHNRVTEDLR